MTEKSEFCTSVDPFWEVYIELENYNKDEFVCRKMDISVYMWNIIGRCV